MAEIFQDGGQIVNLRKNIFEQSLKAFMLAIQKLKLDANRILNNWDIRDLVFRFTTIVKAMAGIFQDGGQIVNLRKHIFRQSLKAFMLAI